MKEREIPKMTIKKIYSNLKQDLLLCIRFIKQWHPEYVAMYFGTNKWEEIANKLDVICKPFSEVQFMEIEKVIAELHSFFISKPHSEWEKKSKRKSKN